MQMLAKTMAAAFKKKNERCFTCGDKTHFKNTHKKIKLLKKKKPPRVCPCCHKGTHWARKCQSKYDVEEKPISRNSKWGTPQVPINKNQGQTPSFPSNPQHLTVLLSIYQT